MDNNGNICNENEYVDDKKHMLYNEGDSTFQRYASYLLC